MSGHRHELDTVAIHSCCLKNCHFVIEILPFSITWQPGYQAFNIAGARGPAERNILTSEWQWRSLTTRMILKNSRKNSVCRRHCLLCVRSHIIPITNDMYIAVPGWTSSGHNAPFCIAAICFMEQSLDFFVELAPKMFCLLSPLFFPGRKT